MNESEKRLHSTTTLNSIPTHNLNTQFKAGFYKRIGHETMPRQLKYTKS
jgi:hypothetical protein